MLRVADRHAAPSGAWIFHLVRRIRGTRGRFRPILRKVKVVCLLAIMKIAIALALTTFMAPPAPPWAAAQAPSAGTATLTLAFISAPAEDLPADRPRLAHANACVAKFATACGGQKPIAQFIGLAASLTMCTGRSDLIHGVERKFPVFGRRLHDRAGGRAHAPTLWGCATRQKHS